MQAEGEMQTWRVKEQSHFGSLIGAANLNIVQVDGFTSQTHWSASL